jgi:chemotaxis protein methyltransferase WspC
MIATVDIHAIEALLGSRIGLDPASIGRDEVRRAVRRRMVDLGCDTISEYLDLIARGEEWDELVELVLVPETWFFREPAAFALVTRRAREHVAAGHARHFRVLSMPCSTGAEPYSVAITLREAGLAPDRFRVEALDLSQRALAEARVGLYGARAVRHVPPPLLAAYFVPVGDTWEVSRDARRGVNFSRGNVVDPDVLRGVAPFDIVFCRNVLIYLDATARLRLLDTAAHLLRDDGVLVTGHAETSNVVDPLFVSAGVPRTFAYVKRPVDSSSKRAPSVSAPVPGRLGTQVVLLRASSSTRSRGAAPGPRGAAARGRSAPDDSQGLERIKRLGDSGRLSEAIAEGERWIAAHPSSAEGHFLLAVAASAAGRFEAAEKALRRALYLEPSHAGALTQLAALRERAGDVQEAARLRRRVQGNGHRGSRP